MLKMLPYLLTSERHANELMIGIFRGTSSYTRNKSFAGSSLPAETKALRMDRWTDGPTDRRTNGHTLLESRGSLLKSINYGPTDKYALLL